MWTPCLPNYFFSKVKTGGRQNISKVLLRHANLTTTQIYLGKVSDVEAIRWIENLHG
jgi:hypothetical protein